jgi:hypothetical protein
MTIAGRLGRRVRDMIHYVARGALGFERAGLGTGTARESLLSPDLEGHCAVNCRPYATLVLAISRPQFGLGKLCKSGLRRIALQCAVGELLGIGWGR